MAEGKVMTFKAGDIKHDGLLREIARMRGMPIDQLADELEQELADFRHRMWLAELKIEQHKEEQGNEQI